MSSGTADADADVAGALDAGLAALDAGRWAEAREHFDAALALGGEEPRAWDGLGHALRALDDAAGCFAARARAFRGYCESGRKADAALVAGWIALDTLLLRGEAAVAQGWFARARRLLDACEPGPEHAWVAIQEGLVALFARGDAATAADAGGRAVAAGEEAGDADLALVGRALGGLGRVALGDVAGGMRDLDEASAAATAGEVRSALLAGLIWCHLIYACERVRDVERAAQWCATVQAHAERLRHRQFFGFCRTHYARVLSDRGDWREAERELRSAGEDFEASAPALAFEAALVLADVRRRQGRLDEAQELCAPHAWHPVAQLTLAEIAWARGAARAARAARDLLERRARKLGPAVSAGECGALELRVRVHAALAEPARAREALAALQTLAARGGTRALEAAALHAAGVVAAAVGRDEEAARTFEDALDGWAQAGMPFEATRARVALARTLERDGRDAEAAVHWEAAHEALAALDVALDPRLLDRPLAQAAADAPEPGELSPRELEVLRLVAAGLGDREIAERLVLSPHTVHRHVANIRAKLRLPSRAAAAAYAARSDLI